MLTGKRFKLEKPTLAIAYQDGTRVIVPIPAGDIVELVENPSPGNQTVDVLWQGRTVAMYALDLKRRCMEARNE